MSGSVVLPSFVPKSTNIEPTSTDVKMVTVTLPSIVSAQNAPKLGRGKRRWEKKIGIHSTHPTDKTRPQVHRSRNKKPKSSLKMGQHRQRETRGWRKGILEIK